MPSRSPRICRQCHLVVCVCTQAINTTRDLYGTSAWQTARAEFLSMKEHTFCNCGCGRLAQVVDHIIPHRGDLILFWNRSNWQCMAAVCHNIKTNKEMYEWFVSEGAQ